MVHNIITFANLPLPFVRLSKKHGKNKLFSLSAPQLSQDLTANVPNLSSCFSFHVTNTFIVNYLI